MCFPVLAAAGTAAGAAAAGTAASTFATLSTAASIAGTAVSAFGMVQQSRAAKAQGKYQAQVARNNQEYLNAQARRVREEGNIAAQQARRRARALESRQKAVFGSSGIDVGAGTPVDIYSDTRMFGEVDALTIRDRYESEAVNLEQQGRNQGAQAGLYSAAGRNQYTSGLVGAGGSILSSIGTVAGRWYRFKNEGVFPE